MPQMILNEARRMQDLAAMYHRHAREALAEGYADLAQIYQRRGAREAEYAAFLCGLLIERGDYAA